MPSVSEAAFAFDFSTAGAPPSEASCEPKASCFASEASAARILAAHLAGCTARIHSSATIRGCSSAKMPDIRCMLACACEWRAIQRMHTARCTMLERAHHAAWRGFLRPAKMNRASSKLIPCLAQYRNVAYAPQRWILRASSVHPARIAYCSAALSARCLLADCTEGFFAER